MWSPAAPTRPCRCYHCSAPCVYPAKERRRRQGGVAAVAPTQQRTLISVHRQRCLAVEGGSEGTRREIVSVVLWSFSSSQKAYDKAIPTRLQWRVGGDQLGAQDGGYMGCGCTGAHSDVSLRWLLLLILQHWCCATTNFSGTSVCGGEHHQRIRRSAPALTPTSPSGGAPFTQAHRPCTLGLSQRGGKIEAKGRTRNGKGRREQTGWSKLQQVCT